MSEPAGDRVPLADQVADLHWSLEALQRGTAGLPARHRAAAYSRWRARAVKVSPGVLARAVDPLTVQTPALDLIDEILLDVAEGRSDRVIITMPPQEGKSTRCARVGPLWFLARDPELRVAIGSYADTLAMGHGRWIRDTVLQHGSDASTRRGSRDILGIRVDPASSAKGEWDLYEHRGGVKAVGVGAGLTGFPVDIMIVDDPVKDRKQADSLTYRNAVWDWWTEVVIPRLAPGGAVILVMTRWHEDDLAGRLIAQDEALPQGEQEWRVIHIPAECEDPATDPLGRGLGEFLASARRRTSDQWRRIKISVGARAWAALYQGHPSPVEGGIFQWDWIRPFRTRAAPALSRVVVAVDPTGGGHDAAGIVTAGIGADRRTYVLGDRSSRHTAGGQWRAAWCAVLDHQADVLVYEKNLVDPVMRKAVPASWARMRQQATALAATGVIAAPEGTELRPLILAAAETLAVGGGDDDVASATDPAEVLAGQLEELLPYAARVLDSPALGPARVEGVSATRGKRTRAEPCAQAYETGQVSHVGVFPALEAELVTWQEGMDSPNRLDALVWAWTYLNRHTPGAVTSPARGGQRVPRGPAAARRR